MIKRNTAFALLFCLMNLTFTNLASEASPGPSDESQVLLEEQQEGRRRIVFDATLYGLMLYGPGTVSLLDIESARQVVGLELLFGSGAFWSALKLTEDHRLGAGRSKLMRWGSYAGTLFGLGIPVFFETENDKAYWTGAMLGTPLGGLTANMLSSHRWYEKGETDLLTNGGLVGGFYGLAIPYLINIDNLEKWDEAQIYTAFAMVGVPVGVWTTSRLIRGKSISQGRAHLISLGGVVGAAYAAGIVHLAGVEFAEHPRPYVSAAMLGLPLGAYISGQLTDSGEYTFGRALLITLGGFVGTLSGSGALLIADVSGENSKSYVLANILGSALGMWYTHRFTRGWGEELASVEDNLSSVDEGFSMELMRISF